MTAFQLYVLRALSREDDLATCTAIADSSTFLLKETTPQAVGRAVKSLMANGLAHAVRRGHRMFYFITAEGEKEIEKAWPPRCVHKADPDECGACAEEPALEEELA